MVPIKFLPILCMLAVALGGQPRSMMSLPPGSQKVEIKGAIERVQAAPGEGMPYLELKTEKGVQRVMLGSMRYMLEKNFNPKAGSVAVVKGFQVNDAVVAQSVAIPAEKVTLQLRDDNGVPLWRMGRYGWGKK